MSDRGIKGRRKNILQEFFKTNKSMAVLLPVLVVAVIALVIFYSSSDSKPVLETKCLQRTCRDTSANGAYKNPIRNPVQVWDPSSRWVFSTLKGITLHEKTEKTGLGICRDIIEDN